MQRARCSLLTNQELASQLARELVREPIVVDRLESAEEALGAAGIPLVLIIETSFTDLGVSEFLRRLRERRPEPLVMVAGPRLDEIDRVVAFELGADDLVELPASPREIALRVLALLRRAERAKSASAICFGPLVIDGPGHIATVSGTELELSVLEFRLLDYLARHAGHVCSRRGLLEAIWRRPQDVHLRRVDTQIKRLRDKMGAAAKAIETVRGFGYRFRPEVLGTTS